MSYAQHYNPNRTPQTEQAEPHQVQNSASGYSFAITPWQRLERWLIIGSEGGSYYATERRLTRENAKTIEECLASDPVKTVETIATISEAGRAPKNDPSIFALALAAAHSDPKARKSALAALPRVCRTGTHLFQFVDTVKQFRGLGRGLRDAIADWYTGKPLDKVAYQVVKYRNRERWTHRDVLRIAHPKSADHQALFRWVTQGEVVDSLPQIVHGYLHAQTEPTPAVIREYGLTHEMLPSESLASPEIWEALLDSMPIGAMIRNLGRMSANGLLKPMGEPVATVIGRLGDEERIRKSRVHPISVLTALLTYKSGHGQRGKLTWSPVPQIVDALDGAFYSAFGNVEPSGKPTLLALDVSGSMGWPDINGVPGFNPRVASAAMAMVTASTESNWHVLGFSHNLIDIPISPRQRLDDVVRTISGLPFGGTDCALPMLHAAGNSLSVDTFVVYTDSETWAGRAMHPHQALKAYRAKSGRAAKLAVLGMVSNGFSIADPNDAGMMDFIGFDTSTPQVLADFARSC